ncbi:hypothetical protein ABC255_08695 [Neobacillus sp. 3P2-tot-E-2]
MLNFINTDLERNLNVLRESQQEEKQWKDDVILTLRAIDEKLSKLLESK